MTTYRAIADSELTIDAPITTQLVTALRDNPIAIAEGDSSAPTTARSGQTSSNGTLTKVIFADAFKKPTLPTPGFTCIFEQNAVAVSADTSLLSFRCKQSGVYRFHLTTRNGTTEQRNDSTNTTSRATVKVKITDHSDDDSVETISGLTHDVSHFQVNYQSFNMTVNDTETVFIAIEEPDDNIQLSMTLRVGVSDDDAMYGISLRGNIT